MFCLFRGRATSGSMMVSSSSRPPSSSSSASYNFRSGSGRQRLKERVSMLAMGGAKAEVILSQACFYRGNGKHIFGGQGATEESKKKTLAVVAKGYRFRRRRRRGEGGEGGGGARTSLEVTVDAASATEEAPNSTSPIPPAPPMLSRSLGASPAPSSAGAPSRTPSPPVEASRGQQHPMEASLSRRLSPERDGGDDGAENDRPSSSSSPTGATAAAMADLVVEPPSRFRDAEGGEEGQRLFISNNNPSTCSTSSRPPLRPVASMPPLPEAQATVKGEEKEGEEEEKEDEVVTFAYKGPIYVDI